MEELELTHRKFLLDVERPRLDDPLYLKNEHPIRYGTDPFDGMPAPLTEITLDQSKAPLLTPDRFICMEHIIPAKGLFRREKKVSACKHYHRQLLPSSSDPTYSHCMRYCAVMRDSEGELMSLNDQEVLACDFREPRLPLSDERLAEHDRKIRDAQQERLREEQAEIFDPMKELEKEND